MPNHKPPKKSETIEIRLPHAAKTAFAARCRDDGWTVSEAVRTFIDREIDGQCATPARRRIRAWPALAAAVAGLALGAVAAPSLAQTGTSSRAAFDRLDQNRDGVVSYAEFQSR